MRIDCIKIIILNLIKKIKKWHWHVKHPEMIRPWLLPCCDIELCQLAYLDCGWIHCCQLDNRILIA